MTPRLAAIRTVSHRLFLALFALVAVSIAGVLAIFLFPGQVAGGTPLMVFFVGVIGGFVGLQRRLKQLSEDDLVLLEESWVYVFLSPLVGGILAVLTYVLFISELLSGELFPSFVADLSDQPPLLADVDGALALAEALARCGVDVASQGSQEAANDQNEATGLSVLFAVHGAVAADYAKLIVWCFLAGFSERFVVNVISQFESRASSPQ